MISKFSPFFFVTGSLFIKNVRHSQKHEVNMWGLYPCSPVGKKHAKANMVSLFFPEPDLLRTLDFVKINSE